jgi:hypothetical protein
MKFLIGLMTAILITGIVSAQHGNTPPGHVNIGLKGGLNLYNIHNDDNIKFDSRVGYHFGLLGHIHFDNHFAFQPEIVFSAQGAKPKNLDYINVPVLFQYMFDNGFRLQAGPQVGFLIRADNKNDYKPIDFGLSAGASYVFPPTGFGVDARYNFGLTNINKNGAVNSTNRGFQFGIFYIFKYNNK